MVAAPNGDIVATGRQIDSRGLTAAVTAVRFDAAGTLQWRVDSSGAILSVGRLLVDSGGNSYVGYNSIFHKYSPAGALLWETSTSVPDGGAALSPDGADVVLTGSPRGGASWITAAFDAATGARRWLVSAPEGIAATDVIVDRRPRLRDRSGQFSGSTGSSRWCRTPGRTGPVCGARIPPRQASPKPPVCGSRWRRMGALLQPARHRAAGTSIGGSSPSRPTVWCAGRSDVTGR